MFDSLRPSGQETGDRALSSSTGRAVSVFSRSLRAFARRPFRRQFAQLFALIWVVGAIVAYPLFEARREREARELVLRLGGRYNLDQNSLAEMLPTWLRNHCGGEYLYPVRSINLSRCDVSDEDIDVLLQFRGLEQINLCGCRRVSRDSIAQLRSLPRMKLVWVTGMSVREASDLLMGETMAASGN